jgi:hypothetical protein
VKLVRAGLGDHIHAGARFAAGTGVEHGSLNLEFLDSIRVHNRNSRRTARIGRKAVAGPVHDARAVLLEVVLRLLGAVHRELLRALADVARVKHAGIGPGRETQQHGVVARRQRHGRHHLRIHHRAHGSGFGLYHFRLSANLHLLRLRANLQGLIQNGRLRNGDRHRRNLQRVEAGSLKLHAIIPRRQQSKLESALRARGRGMHLSSIQACQRNRHIRHHSVGGVFQSPGQRAGRCRLAEQRRTQRHGANEQCQQSHYKHADVRAPTDFFKHSHPPHIGILL